MALAKSGSGCLEWAMKFGASGESTWRQPRACTTSLELPWPPQIVMRGLHFTPSFGCSDRKVYYGDLDKEIVRDQKKLVPSRTHSRYSTFKLQNFQDRKSVLENCGRIAATTARSRDLERRGKKSLHTLFSLRRENMPLFQYNYGQSIASIKSPCRVWITH